MNDLVAGIATILAVIVYIVWGIAGEHPLTATLGGSDESYISLGWGRLALWFCQVVAIVGAVLLMTIGHRSALARTLATLGAGAMFSFSSIWLFAAMAVFADDQNWLLAPLFVLCLVAVVMLLIPKRSKGNAAHPSSAVPQQTFAMQGMPPQSMSPFGMPQQAMAQGVAPQQGQPHYQGMLQPGMPQRSITPGMLVQQPGSPGMVPQAEAPQPMPSASMPQQAIPQQGMSPGGAPAGGNQPATSNPGYPQAGRQFTAPPTISTGAQVNPPQF